MSELIELNIINGTIVFFAAIIPIYLSVKLKGKLRILTLLLALFVTVHSTYHITDVFEYEEIAETIIEPISIVLLITFGLVYLRILKVRRIKA